MSSRPPPPRYRVVERGRRLEVIDTLTGAVAQSRAKPSASAPTSRWPTLPEQEGFDGRALLVTHRWYDHKAPRRVHLDPGAVQMIGLAKAAVVALATLAIVAAVLFPAALALLLLPLHFTRAPARERLRNVATGWLDRLGGPPG